MKKSIFLLIFICFYFVSCKSVKVQDGLKDQGIFVMVYDLNNSPVENVSFYHNNQLVGKTDVEGRVILKCPDLEKIDILVKKYNYEEIQLTFDYVPHAVFYIKMGSYNQLIDIAEQLLLENNYNEADILLSKIEKINPKSQDFILLRMIYYKKIKDVNNEEKYFNLLSDDVKAKL